MSSLVRRTNKTPFKRRLARGPSRLRKKKNFNASSDLNAGETSDGTSKLKSEVSVVPTPAQKPSYAPPRESCTASQVRDLLSGTSSLWEDPYFPADNSSLFYDSEAPDYMPRNIIWARPSEIVDDPAFITDGVTRFDINQGSLGDCWFLASLATLTLKPNLLRAVMDEKQSFKPDQGYCGIFSFRFFYGGQWQEVTVDDRLPTVNKKLIFLQSEDRREFWPSLIEKAFAKLQGSYAGLNGGTFGESCAFLGAITEYFNIRGPYMPGHDPKFVKMRLIEASKRMSVAGAAIYDVGTNTDSFSRYGLPVGHAYSVTGANKKAVRIRNPWGRNLEWKMQTSRPDGEFLMDWDSFMAHFHQIQVAHFSLDSATWQNGNPGKSWACTSLSGAWNPLTAGGNPTYKTFLANPQYQVTVGEQGKGNEKVSILIALDQISSRRLELGMEKLPIGFTIFKSSKGKKLTQNELNKAWVADSGIYRYEKQIVGRFSVKPGTYTIVPATFYPSTEGDFCLRVWHHENKKSSNKVNLFNLDEKDD